MPFDSVDPRQSFPALEHGILKYWKEEDIFKRSIGQRMSHDGDPLNAPSKSEIRNESTNPSTELRTGKRINQSTSFSFYDGPPFATGLPHYGHLLAGTIKDVIPRYRTMRGDSVPRRFGWDCHGLPIENMIEKEQKLTSRKDIERMGVKAFNKLCRDSVMRYTKEWRTTVERLGRFVDMDFDYRTMDPEYMESIWWVFKQLHDKGLIYEGHKPMHICPRCATSLSNFEVGLGYRDRTDMSVIATFPLIDEPETVLLAWTTTPWSLPGNFWLAVGPAITYAKVAHEGKTYILAQSLVEHVFKGKDHEIKELIGAEALIGKRYEPLFPYFVDTVMPSSQKSEGKRVTYGERVFKIISNIGVEVSDQEGTGIVHLTSSTGEDSNAVAMAEKVDVLPHVWIDGNFIDAVTDFSGLNAKPEGKDPMATDKAVIENLKKRDRVFSHFTITHSYPHCWRCDTPLLPYTTNSWFVAVEKIKDRMLAANAKTEWVPAHLRDGRFGKWLEGARDWAISRSRYWGTPLPIWRCPETRAMEVIGSRDELMAKQPIRFTKLSVLRHAQSEGNKIPIYQGKTPGTPLTELGRRQAEAAGERLAVSGERSANSQFFPKGPSAILNSQLIPSIIYCSPLARTKETAEIIAKSMEDRNVPVPQIVIDERLREVTFGEHEGKHVDFSDLAFVQARRAHKLETGKPESIYHLEGMETWSQVQARVGSFLREMLPKHRGEHVVIVTHADPIVNMKHFFTKEEPVKLSHQPYPKFAETLSLYWDHTTEAAMDLHKENVDEVTWPSSGKSDKSVELTLVRHGETELNAKRIVQGITAKSSLNEKGRAQVEALGETLAKEHFDVIISSDQSRAVESVEILARKLGITELHQWQELRERDRGQWSGKHIADLLKEYPLPEGENTTTFHYLTPEDGESLTVLMKRAERVYQKILEDFAGKKVLLVSHRGIIRALLTFIDGLSYRETLRVKVENIQVYERSVNPLLHRIPEVLDCWFESGSMPYAHGHYPFALTPHSPLPAGRGDGGEGPPGFPADFIAEGIDQTRGWFYTLTVLATALFDSPAFMHCVVNGTVLAADGKKMSKRLKNYPEPLEVVEKHGADAVRFALMSSPAVRGEDLRFSEKLVEEQLRSVLLPLWNTYSFFVTYANAAGWEPALTGMDNGQWTMDNQKRKTKNEKHVNESVHPLDAYIRAEVQDLVNRMTQQLDAYDLSATCAELSGTIDALTNWYVRLSRRRFAGKGELGKDKGNDQELATEREDALCTLYDVLVTLAKLLAPFCPFIADAMYLNLAGEPHSSIHLTDWPAVQALTKDEELLLMKTRALRTVVSLGMKIRSEQKIGVRQPLLSATIALPKRLQKSFALAENDLELLREELNVKDMELQSDPRKLATEVAQVDARKVGPRLGSKVQELIAAGKRGEFKEMPDGSIEILGETLSTDEAHVVYLGKEDQHIDTALASARAIAADRGFVVSLDITVTPELALEGQARTLIRAIQRLRKDSDYALNDRVTIAITGAETLLQKFSDLVIRETNVTLGKTDGIAHKEELDNTLTVIITMARHSRAPVP